MGRRVMKGMGGMGGENFKKCQQNGKLPKKLFIVCIVEAYWPIEC